MENRSADEDGERYVALSDITSSAHVRLEKTQGVRVREGRGRVGGEAGRGEEPTEFRRIFRSIQYSASPRSLTGSFNINWISGSDANPFTIVAAYNNG